MRFPPPPSPFPQTFNTQYRELYRECSRLQSFTSKYREQYEDRAEEIKRLREDNEVVIILGPIISLLVGSFAFLSASCDWTICTTPSVPEFSSGEYRVRVGGDNIVEDPIYQPLRGHTCHREEVGRSWEWLYVLNVCLWRVGAFFFCALVNEWLSSWCSHFHRMEKPHVVESLAALLQSPSSSRKAGRRRPAGSGSAVSGRNPSPSRVATTTPTRSVSRNQHSSEVPGAPSTPTRGSKGKPPVPRGALRSSSPAGSRRVSSSRLRDPSPAHRRHDMSREIVEAASSGMAQHSTTRLDSPSPTFTAGPPSLDGSGSELEEKLLGSYSPLSADHREEAGSAASSL